MYKILKDSERR